MLLVLLREEGWGVAEVRVPTEAAELPTEETEEDWWVELESDTRELGELIIGETLEVPFLALEASSSDSTTSRCFSTSPLLLSVGFSFGEEGWEGVRASTGTAELSAEEWEENREGETDSDA